MTLAKVKPTTVSELERFTRERRDADRRYNDALTALDRAVVAVNSGERSPEDFDSVATALIVFLQQVTAFVESKDREQAAATGARIDAVQQALEPLAEVRAQVSVLQRATETLRRRAQASGLGPPAPVVSPQSPALSPQPSGLRSPTEPASFGQARQSAEGATAAALSPDEEYKYLGFEDQFRGSDAIIEERLRAYLPIFTGRSDVLDIGCGRGELLAAMRAAGVHARGIDANSEMVAVARERGLEAERADALGYLEGLADASLGGLVSTQVVEHLEPSYLTRLLDVAAQKLQPGSPIVIETINPACWLAFFSSYIRDLTHVRPVHPETLQYLLRASGFERVEIRYSAPVPEHMKMKTVEIPGEILASTDPSALALARIAHAVSANAIILNNLMFTHLDYAAVGYRA